MRHRELGMKWISLQSHILSSKQFPWLQSHWRQLMSRVYSVTASSIYACLRRIIWFSKCQLHFQAAVFANLNTHLRALSCFRVDISHKRGNLHEIKRSCNSDFRLEPIALLPISVLFSAYCMREFEIALHRNVTVLRKKRLVVLMKTSIQNGDCEIENESSTVTLSLRQYLRQYTYVDCSANDWFTRLLYTLPINGMLQKGNDDVAGERTPLLWLFRWTASLLTSERVQQTYKPMVT